ncbi:WD40 repeat [Macleaya cordata]|uniref:WD40 repeat n=1 Tax=Macleaya cordata TaxID=56857 RepID=A0A200QRX5_MACCD|nr:WD40 repeat [Macleaya cordata]
MSKPGDEEEEEEYFYESLDRILSSSASSSSSCSSSAEEDNCNDFDFPNYASFPRFPMSLSNYDIWISEPSSIEERRKRLLRQMGLSSDASLCRLKSTVSTASSYGRSVSSDRLLAYQPEITESDGNSNSNPTVVRSKSDGTDYCISSSSYDHHCNSSTFSPISINSIHSIQSVVETPPLVNNNQNLLPKKPQNNQCNGSLTAGVGVASSPNKPPLGKPSHSVEEIRVDSTNMDPPNSNSNSSPVLTNPGCGEFNEDSCCNGVVKDPDLVCTIKNLDNGKEFVVNEFREDGMWNKLREVGTGRQLTMEEFQLCVGHSPIVQELMRRQNVEESNGRKDGSDSHGGGNNGGGMKSKKKGNWFKNIRSVASSVTGHHRERRSSDERDTSSEKGGRRSSSATDDSQDVSFHGPERARVRQYGKSCKELSALYKSQEIQAHNGSIWCIKFSLDGRYLASAGEDCVIHVWQVLESERKGDLLMEKSEDGNSHFYFAINGSPELTLVSSNVENHLEKKRRGRPSISRKSISLDHIVMPESVFALSEKPICSFQGHLADVLDLSWSKSQYLLSSSMDKTVRLWHMASNSCLKMFTHSDYVTCIQFNPVDDRYFISGSLDAKVRIWSIPDRQVVDWSDLHEMVTAACYTPDGQGALVGSYKGSCCLYNTSENKLHQKSRINLQNKKKRSHLKKITGFQFAPGSSSEVIITSADSRIRVIDGVDLVHKFKGFRNTSSQISASLTANGKYVVCASGDSNVYMWKHEADSRPSRSRSVTVTHSYEHFHCQDVSVAIPWPGFCGTEGIPDSYSGELNVLVGKHSPLHLEETNRNDESSPAINRCTSSPLPSTISSSNNSYFFDRFSVTWPEEKLIPATRNRSPHGSVDFSNWVKQVRSSAWGMENGYQNFPDRLHFPKLTAKWWLCTKRYLVSEACNVFGVVFLVTGVACACWMCEMEEIEHVRLGR